MPPFSTLVPPRCIPPLDQDFRPAALVLRAFATGYRQRRSASHHWGGTQQR